MVMISAQKNDRLKVSYIMEINNNNTYSKAENPQVECDLYIENGVSRFITHYDLGYIKYPGEMPRINMAIYKDFNKNEMYGRAYGYKNNEYIIKDSLNIIPWKLEEKSKIVDGKTYKLATAHWRDFDWEAWYDESIPIPEGPNKLHGLPGLIVEAKAKACSGTTDTFKLVKIEIPNTGLEKYIFFPFAKEGFKFIDYATFYQDEEKRTMNNLKNSHLRFLEENKNPNIVSGPTCISSNTFDSCFCYPK